MQAGVRYAWTTLAFAEPAMKPICLEAATSRDELVLFDTRAISNTTPPDANTLAALQAQAVLLRLPTGADGHYLLHLYVNAPIPAETLKYCDTADMLQGSLHCASGRLTFGGAETAYRDFVPTGQQCSETEVPPGTYACTAYHSELPGKLLRAAMEVHLSQAELRLLKAPMYGLVSFGVVGVVLAWAIHPLLLPVLWIAGWLGAQRIRASSAWQALGPRMRQAHIAAPSIVIAMTRQADDAGTVIGPES